MILKGGGAYIFCRVFDLVSLKKLRSPFFVDYIFIIYTVLLILFIFKMIMNFN